MGTNRSGRDSTHSWLCRGAGESGSKGRRKKNGFKPLHHAGRRTRLLPFALCLFPFLPRLHLNRDLQLNYFYAALRMSSMQPYDMVMIGVLASATLLGFVKGMARQIASLAAIVGSYLLALRLSPELAKHIAQPEPLNRYLAMLAIYLAGSLVIWLVYRQVSQIIARVQLREFDRQIGALFGAAKGLLLCMTITFFAVTLSAKSRETVLASQSGNRLSRVMLEAGPLMPKELQATLGPYLNEFERKLAPSHAAVVRPRALGSSISRRSRVPRQPE